ncbi:hypothetical protein BV95_03523 [Sphingobium chlorophenolicum]|uniref:Uncharacterized protein n=1 Tax=Sphingobium chlorophenolicum TaxID=46429 RepID=A0A081RAG2_SPHCR|nr:hypothetical protein BV95_03523 [Sphingobium chlorophenolicum]
MRRKYAPHEARCLWTSVFQKKFAGRAEIKANGLDIKKTSYAPLTTMSHGVMRVTVPP